MNYSELKEIIEDLAERTDCTLDKWTSGYGLTFYTLKDPGYDSLGSIEIAKEKNIGFEDYQDRSKWYVIYYFKDHDVYIKFKGYCSSYSGTYFNEMIEVTPEKVNKIKFKKV